MRNMSNQGTVITVESVFDPYADSQLWYYIPGFNGYEISNLGYVRSMKFYKKYPFGTLIQPKSDTTFELSDNNNERVRITKAELWNLAITNPHPVYGYPRPTCRTDTASRNKRAFVTRKKRKYKEADNRTTFFPSFTVVKDNTDEHNGIKRSPIFFTNK